MENISLLFRCNGTIKPKYSLKNGSICIDVNDIQINGNTIKRIIGWINWLELKYKDSRIPISFVFHHGDINDKLTYIILECILYYLNVTKKQDVRVYIFPKISIEIEGIMSSPLLLLGSPKLAKRKEYGKKFEKDIFMNHFRKLVKRLDVGILDEINYFLKAFKIDDDSREEISEVFSELISNGTEHGDSECLIDIDVTDDYKKSGDTSQSDYYGINIVVLNFSNELLGTRVKHKILSDSLKTPRYLTVKEAYVYHKEFFSEQYKEEDFFNIVAFQDRISGRMDEELTGGTGLTLLIKSLEQRSDANYCYVLSGNRVLAFWQQFLEYNDKNWLGFNEKRDFITSTPDTKCLCTCDIFFPGTAYNLHFIMEKQK